MRQALNYSLKRTTDPAIEPVTVQEVRDHIADADAATDEQVQSWIAAARSRVERDTRRALITQTWTMKLDRVPTWSDHIELYKPPLISVSSITYIDTDGASQTWATSNYEVDTNRTPGVVWLKFDKTWPDTRDIQNSMTIVYTAGYGATRSSVPEDAKQAIRMLVQQWSANRGPEPDERREYMSIVYGLRPGGYF